MRSDRYADNTENAITNEAEIEERYASEIEAEKKVPKRFGRIGKKESPDDEAQDLSKLKKKDLLEIMLAQGKEIDSLRERVAELESELANREFEFSKIGSIAEASLAVTNIFKEAEKAADIYMENIRRRCEQKE